MTNTITFYFVLNSHLTIPFWSLRPLYSYIESHCMTLHINQSNTQELYCVTTKELHSSCVYSKYTPELDFSSLFLTAKILLQFLFRFPHVSEEILNLNVVSTVLTHIPRHVYSSTSTLELAL